MPKPPKNNKNKNSKKIILASIATVIFILISLFVYQNYLKTYPLGDNDKLQYIGKVDYGCWLCDSQPSSTYYYATDMTPEEIAGYFGKTDNVGYKIQTPLLSHGAKYIFLDIPDGKGTLVLGYDTLSDTNKEKLKAVDGASHYLDIPKSVYDSARKMVK